VANQVHGYSLVTRYKYCNIVYFLQLLGTGITEKDVKLSNNVVAFAKIAVAIACGTEMAWNDLRAVSRRYSSNQCALSNLFYSHRDKSKVFPYKS
jgi:hypothetical protein